MYQLRQMSHAELREGLGYALLLCVALVLFSALLSLNLRRTMTATLDQTLQAAAVQVSDRIELADGQLRFQPALGELADELSAEQLSGRLLALDGTVRDGFGGYAQLPPARPSAAGSTRLRGTPDAWRVYTSRVITESGSQIGWVQIATSLAPVERAVGTLGAQLLLGLPVMFVVVGAGAVALRRSARRDVAAQRYPAAAATTLLPVDPALTPEPVVAREQVEPFPRAPDAPIAGARQPLLEHALAAMHRPLDALQAVLGPPRGTRSTKREYEAALVAAAQHAAELQSIYADLALIAAEGAPATHAAASPIAIIDLVAQAIVRAQPALDARGIALFQELHAGPVLVGAHAELLRLCTTMIEAAADGMPAGGSITIGGNTATDSFQLVVAGSAPAAVSVSDADAAATGSAWLQIAAADALARRQGGTLTTVQAPTGPVLTLALPVEAPTEPLAVVLGAHARTTS